MSAIEHYLSNQSHRLLIVSFAGYLLFSLWQEKLSLINRHQHKGLASWTKIWDNFPCLLQACMWFLWGLHRKGRDMLSSTLRNNCRRGFGSWQRLPALGSCPLLFIFCFPCWQPAFSTKGDWVYRCGSLINTRKPLMSNIKVKIKKSLHYKYRKIINNKLLL